ncbi:calpain-A-like [Drosophila subobscura]|uniref:calpain-A-like n=1 Tax=Drosophila subobscura TaxID=7241 RepID=UPI00155B2CF8|nr:calpain-A-like [Drosophila subobscura]
MRDKTNFTFLYPVENLPNRQGKIPMIRMRNPWGNEAEWNGPWSDSSAEWRYIPEDQKQEIGLTFDRDGEFWMSFQDFLHHFDRVEICNLSPDSLTEDQQNSGKRKWEMSMYEGEWTPGVTAGGCRNFLDTFWHNPQYIITLVDPDGKADTITPGYPTPKPLDPQKESLRRLFDSIAGKDMEVDWMELKRILDHSMRDDLPKPVVYNRFTANNAFETQAAGRPFNVSWTWATFPTLKGMQKQQQQQQQQTLL